MIFIKINLTPIRCSYVVHSFILAFRVLLRKSVLNRDFMIPMSKIGINAPFSWYGDNGENQEAVVVLNPFKPKQKW